MMKIDVSFIKKIFGYDVKQVDGYIEKLARAYQTAYDEYNILYAKYRELNEKRETEQPETAPEFDYGIVAKTLVNAEVLAKKTIDDAREEAAKIITTSEKIKSDAFAIKENAFVAKATAEIQAQRIAETAEANAAAAKEAARRIIEAANSEAEKAKATAVLFINKANTEEAAAKETAKEIIEAAKIEAENARKAAQRINEAAKAETAMAKEAAKQIINAANAEAVLIIEAARKSAGTANSGAARRAGDGVKAGTASEKISLRDISEPGAGATAAATAG